MISFIQAMSKLGLDHLLFYLLVFVKPRLFSFSDFTKFHLMFILQMLELMLVKFIREKRYFYLLMFTFPSHPSPMSPIQLFTIVTATSR